MSSHFNRTPDKTDRARRLRREATEVEKKLWLYLRGKQVGVSFRRQHPIGSYIADFCAPSIKLVVELDGGQHERASNNDVVRTADLNKRGFRVLRFWNNDVIENAEGVAQRILDVVAELKTTPP